MNEKDVLSEIIMFLKYNAFYNKSTSHIENERQVEIDFLHRILVNSTAEQRSLAAFVLGQITDDKSVPLLIDALNDETARVREEAARALGYYKIKDVIQPLINCIKEDKHEFVRWTASISLSKIGDLAIPYLIDLHTGSSVEARFLHLTALAHMEESMPITLLIRSLDAAESRIRAAAAIGLGRSKNAAAIDSLILALDDVDATVRWRAAEALGKLGDKKAIDPLIYKLSDTNRDVRWYIAKALSILGSEVGVSYLIAFLADTSAEMRYITAKALGEVGDPHALPFLLYLEKNETSQTGAGNSVKMSIVRAINQITSKIEK